MSGSTLSASLTSFRTTAESSTMRTRMRRELMRLGAERFAVDCGLDHLQLVIQVRQTLGMADEQITIGHEPTRQARDQFLLGGAIEIDHDVAAEDHVKRIGEGRLALEEIQMVKAHAFAQRGLHEGQPP